MFYLFYFFDKKLKNLSLSFHSNGPSVVLFEKVVVDLIDSINNKRLFLLLILSFIIWDKFTLFNPIIFLFFGYSILGY